MNYSQIIKAAPAIGELKKLRLPYATARDVHKLHKLLESEYQFFAQEEAKLIKELAAKDGKGNPKVSGDGRITFADMEARNEYGKRLAELGATDAQIEIPFITISAEEIGEQLIAPETIGALEDFITFE